jgi:hypothetical protein
MALAAGCALERLEASYKNLGMSLMCRMRRNCALSIAHKKVEIGHKSFGLALNDRCLLRALKRERRTSNAIDKKSSRSGRIRLGLSDSIFVYFFSGFLAK